MKKAILILLATIISISLIACGSKQNESLDEIIKRNVDSYVKSYVTFQYNPAAILNITFYIDESGNNEYEVTGKVTVKDKYGDSFTGNYTSFVRYDPETDDCNVISCEIGNLYRK